jgi:hypothetical protein
MASVELKRLMGSEEKRECDNEKEWRVWSNGTSLKGAKKELLTVAIRPRRALAHIQP